MEISFIILKLSLCLSLIAVVSCAQPHPETCNQVECPTYKVLESGNGYEIRVYNSAVWMSTGFIPSSSLVKAAKTGFQRFYSYIQGHNKSKTKMSMTAPVIIQPGKSVYRMLFYLPKKYQSNPPQADGLHEQQQKPTYVAVRQFGGYMSDNVAKKEAAALLVSLKGSTFIGSIKKSKGSYMVAGYNPPSQTSGRVNEIMIPFKV